MNMTHIVALALSLATVPAPAIELLSEGKLSLTPAESEGMVKCGAEGGCHILTARAVFMALSHAYALGEAAGKKESCKVAGDAGNSPATRQ